MFAIAKVSVVAAVMAGVTLPSLDNLQSSTTIKSAIGMAKVVQLRLMLDRLRDSLFRDSLKSRTESASNETIRLKLIVNGISLR